MMKPFIAEDSSYITSSALCLACLTFKHFHSHSGVTRFSFQPERCGLHNFSKLPLTQSLAKYKVFTRKLPLWILLLEKHMSFFWLSCFAQLCWLEISLKEAAYRYFKDVVLNGFLRAAAYVVSWETDGISLSWPSESHLRRGDWGLRRVLVVTVDEVQGQEDGDDEGQQQSSGDDGLTHVVTYHLWRESTLHRHPTSEASSSQKQSC